MGKLLLNHSLLKAPGQRFSLALDNMGNLSFYYQPKQLKPPTILTQEWLPGLASNAQSRFLFQSIARAWKAGVGYSSTGSDSVAPFAVDHAAWLARATSTRMLLKAGYSRYVNAFTWFVRYNLASYFAQNSPAALTPPGTHDASLLPPHDLNYFTSPPDAVYSPPVITAVVPSTVADPTDPFPTIATTPPLGFGLTIGPSFGRPHVKAGVAEYGNTLAGTVAFGVGYADAQAPAGLINGVNLNFTLPSPPSPAASLRLFRNGILLSNPADFSLVGAALTLASAPQAGDTLLASWRFTANSTALLTPVPMEPGVTNYAWAAIQPISLPAGVDPANPLTWGSVVLPILTPGPRKFFLVPMHPPL